MSNFASYAASAREAHEDHFGDSVTYISPTGQSTPCNATIHKETIETEVSPTMGEVQVVKRQIIITKAALANPKRQGKVTIGSSHYSIDSVTRMGSDRNLLNLRLVASEEISRPAYRPADPGRRG